MRKTLYGNGTPGLVTTVTQIIERTEARKELHDRDICRLERVLAWAASSFAGVLIGIIGYLVKLHFGG